MTLIPYHPNIVIFVVQVEGNLAGAADAIMLDTEGFVAETNATNLVSWSQAYIFYSTHQKLFLLCFAFGFILQFTGLCWMRIPIAIW